MVENTDSSWDSGNVLASSRNEDSHDTNNSTSSGGSSDGEDKETQEIPITDKEEALQFAYREMGKLMRKDGHKIELKVIGNIDYRVGAWIRVFLPSFNEDSMMFISKVQHESSADSEWITSLTLVDYPPSVSKGKDNTSSSSLGDSGDGTGGGEGSDSESGSGGSSKDDSKLWTKLSDIVWKYYPSSKNKTYWIRCFKNALMNWTSIARVTNKMGGDSEKQNKVIKEVLKAKNDLQASTPAGNTWDHNSLPKSSAGSNSNYQRGQVQYNKNQSQFYIKNYLNNKNG